MAILEKLKSAMRGKTAALLDLDNTLYAYDPCHSFALKCVHKTYCRKSDKISFDKFHTLYRNARQVIHKRLKGQAASHSRLLYFQTLIEYEIRRPDPALALFYEKVYWDSFFKKMKLAPWVKPFLAFCKKTGRKAGIVTNLTTQLQLRKLEHFKISKLLDFVVTSEEAGVEKPHREIFHLALEKAQTDPSQALVIGDDENADACGFLDFFKI